MVTTRTKLIPDGYWLIWSNEHGAYWRANRLGYCHSVSEAGRYTIGEANRICENAEPGRFNLCRDGHIPPEILVPAPELVSYLNTSVSADAIIRRANRITSDPDNPERFSTVLRDLALSVTANAVYPDWLYDGYLVYQTVKEMKGDDRVSHTAVSDVLDAIHRLMKKGGNDGTGG